MSYKYLVLKWLWHDQLYDIKDWNLKLKYTFQLLELLRSLLKSLKHHADDDNLQNIQIEVKFKSFSRLASQSIFFYFTRKNVSWLWILCHFLQGENFMCRFISMTVEKPIFFESRNAIIEVWWITNDIKVIATWLVLNYSYLLFRPKEKMVSGKGLVFISGEIVYVYKNEIKMSLWKLDTEN